MPGHRFSTETDAELQRFVASAWPAAQCVPQTHVLAGAAVDVILDVAYRHRADLIVVDGGRMSSVERLVFGSTTEGLLRRADVSVLVAPAEWTPPQPHAPDLSDLGPLVVVVDLSDPRSVSATRAACELASVLGTSVEIVHFVPDREASQAVLSELLSHLRVAATQVPPNRCRSTMATDRPALASRLARGGPAWPSDDDRVVVVIHEDAHAPSGLVLVRDLREEGAWSRRGEPISRNGRL